MKACIMTTSFTVMVNGGPLAFFSATRGLRQDDPLSLLLFIIFIQALNRILEKGREENLIKGILVGRGGDQLEVSHLFSADYIDFLSSGRGDDLQFEMYSCVSKRFLG